MLLRPQLWNTHSQLRGYPFLSVASEVFLFPPHFLTSEIGPLPERTGIRRWVGWEWDEGDGRK